jgi:hypothetical protein
MNHFIQLAEGFWPFLGNLSFICLKRQYSILIW